MDHTDPVQINQNIRMLIRLTHNKVKHILNLQQILNHWL
jgi:hypothetical protein